MSLEIKENIREATLTWIDRSFQAIPHSLFIKAYLKSLEDETVKILTSKQANGEYELLTDSNFPKVIGSFFLVSNRLDIEWIYSNLDIVSECGFDVYETNDYVFLAIEGIGYDFVEAHWIPLYEARGLQWHTN